MPAIHEKADGTLVLMVHMTLLAGRDDSLIRLIKSAPHRGLASVIRETMRTGTIEDSSELFSDDSDIYDIPEIGIDI